MEILLGDTDVHLGKAAEAGAMLEPLESANGQNLDFEYVLGSALIEAGQRREGVSRIEKVAKQTIVPMLWRSRETKRGS